MGYRHFVAALAPVLIVTASPVLADDPRDPTMTPEAIARDREIIRRLNREQLAHVRQRDAGYAQGWDAYAAAHGRRAADASDRDDDEYADARDDAPRGNARRQDPQAEYAEAMRQWREDVRACREGYYDACARR